VGIVIEDPTRTINETPPAVQEQPISSIHSATSYGRIAELCPPDVAAAPAADPTGVPSIQSTGGANPQRMVDNLKPLAFAWEKQSGIPATIMLAINASESNWGNTSGNAIFGMGAHGGHTSQTMASVGGVHAEIPDTQALATYPDANGAYADFVDVVTHGRYAQAYANLKAGGSGQQFVTDLQKAGYAEDVDWGAKIASLARRIQGML
jgi:flagellum-specific peptidoglycan hydrolase FlgJ